MSPLLFVQAVLVATIATGLSGSLLAWRERPEPGAVPLAILLAGQCWWSATLFFQITATDLREKVFWVDVSWVGIAVLPVAWLFFCLTYTGYSSYRRPRYVALASVVPAVTVLFALTAEFHDLLYTQSALIEQNGYELLVREPGVWFWVSAGYTYLLGLLGAVPLLQFVRSDVYTFRGQSLALLVGLVVPWATNGLHLLEVFPTGGVDPTPVAFSISAIAFLGALTRFQLFGTSPTPIRPARHSAFHRIGDGIIVLDRNHNVVDLNDNAAAALEANEASWLGSPIENVIPQFDTLTDDGSGQTVVRPGDERRAYDISASELTDAHGRTTGYLVTLSDISEYIRQQQRLEVLNRLFRHNIRTNVQLINSHVEYLAHHNSESRAREATETALKITEFSDKIRSILDVFEQGRTESTPARLGVILRDCIDRIHSQYPDVTVHHDLASRTIYVDSVLDDVVWAVLENAVQHNTNDDPEVRIEVTPNGDRVRIVAVDNGPGINDEELVLLNEGTERPLRHGSGLGLALIAWGVEIAGGRVTFEENDPTGTIVTVDVPVLSPPEQ